MKEVNSLTKTVDKQVALEIINILIDKATEVDYVLELVCSSLITIDEQIANKLHIAMAKTTGNLLSYKQSRIDLGVVSMPFAYANNKLSKLDNESKINSLLNICNVVFPTGELQGYSALSKTIYEDTIKCLKAIIKGKNIQSLNELFKDDWYKKRGDYIILLATNNNLFGE